MFCARSGETLNSLRHNLVKHMPPTIGEATKLVILDLSYNCLLSISPKLANCTQLEQLYLQKNVPNHYRFRPFGESIDTSRH